MSDDWYPSEICTPCGKRHGSKVPYAACFHMGTCGWCGNRDMVTEPRDFGYPPMYGGRPAIATATGTAKTPKAVECEASQSGAKRIAQDPS